MTMVVQPKSSIPYAGHEGTVVATVVLAQARPNKPKYEIAYMYSRAMNKNLKPISDDKDSSLDNKDDESLLDPADSRKGSVISAVQERRPIECCRLCKSWQGVVETITRIISLVLFILLLVCSIVCVYHLRRFIPLNDVATSFKLNVTATAVWAACVACAGMILEVVILTSRFCPCRVPETCGIVSHSMDIIICFVLALALLCAAIPMQVYIQTAHGITIIRGDASIKDQIISAQQGTDAFAYMAMILFVVLGSFMALSVLCKSKNTSRYSTPV